jgi:hypothetical protein
MQKHRPGKNSRFPEIDILAQHYLARGLMKHPDAGEHVAKVDDIESMPMLALLKLAKKLGVDADALAEATEREWDACHRYSDDHPAFTGVLEFDLTVEVFRKRIKSKLRAEYEFTPEWEYWDLHKRAPYVGWSGSSIKVEYLTVPEEDNGLGAPEWEDIDILAIGEVWNHVEDAIEEQCKVEDTERRRLPLKVRGRRLGERGLATSP